MTYREIINSIKPYSYNQYSIIKSDSRLGACVAFYLFEKGVPLTMNYLGIAMFKMFPESFYCDEDFKEFPSLDRLNREICMHMTITKKRTDAILSGSAKNGFQLTNYGKFIGKQVLDFLKNNLSQSEPMQRKPVDNHKHSPISEFERLKKSDLYLEYQKNGKFNEKAIWKLFGVIPFTQIKLIKEKLNLAIQIASDKGENSIVNFAEIILKLI